MRDRLGTYDIYQDNFGCRIFKLDISDSECFYGKNIKRRTQNILVYALPVISIKQDSTVSTYV